MYIMNSNKYAIELVTYLLIIVVYFYELIVYMLLERNAFDSIAFFSQCAFCLAAVMKKFKIAVHWEKNAIESIEFLPRACMFSIQKNML